MSLVAHVRLDALRANLDGCGGAVVDVRADAWGHGAPAVSRIACAAGARAVVADVEDADAIVAAGVPADRVWADGDITVDPHRVFGLDEAAQPVMRLAGSVLSTKALRVGEGVSYGYLYRAERDTHVALVAGGYAQGVVRALGNSADVVIDGRRCPIRGRVAMDVCVVDIGHTAVSRGVTAWFFGDPAAGHPALREWVDATALSAAELVTAVGLHTDRVTS